MLKVPAPHQSLQKDIYTYLQRFRYPNGSAVTRERDLTGVSCALTKNISHRKKKEEDCSYTQMTALQSTQDCGLLISVRCINKGPTVDDHLYCIYKL